MTAPVALKAASLRDSLSKTVRLLTRDGVAVRFRGYQPMVQSKGNKAICLTLPELNDTASPELLSAIHGYLDHEVGHIFYTPFARNAQFIVEQRKRGHRGAGTISNIVEDIRLEKLLPRDLPGTKENLERMYESAIPNLFDPGIRKILEANNPGHNLMAVIVVAMRALSGQKAFQKYMDDNAWWPHFTPVLKLMPSLARRLKEMETFDDVESISADLLDALKKLSEPKEPKEPKERKEPNKPSSSTPPSPPPPADDEDEEDDEDSDGGSSDDGEDDGADDDAGEDGEDDGEGHGDGSGTDDGEDEDGGNCSGDADKPSDPDHSGSDDDAAEDGGTSGKAVGSITEAMKKLDPTQRKAFFLYKKERKSIEEIATALNRDEDHVRQLLRSARKRIGELMKGARA